MSKFSGEGEDGETMIHSSRGGMMASVDSLSSTCYLVPIVR